MTTGGIITVMMFSQYYNLPCYNATQIVYAWKKSYKVMGEGVFSAVTRIKVR